MNNYSLQADKTDVRRTSHGHPCDWTYEATIKQRLSLTSSRDAIV